MQFDFSEQQNEFRQEARRFLAAECPPERVRKAVEGGGFDRALWQGVAEMGFLGIAIPNFMLALIMMYVANVFFGTSIGGLMDPQYIGKPWTWDKLMSVLAHSWIPVVVIGTGGTAGMIRRLRANLLDELKKQYVVTARAKGLPPGKLLRKYPLRMALNFFVSDIGSLLPEFISGSALVAVVLSLPTTGPILVRALQVQDMYLAGSFLMLESFLVVIGVLCSAVAAYFYVRVIVLMFFTDPVGDGPTVAVAGVTTTVVIALAVITTVVLGLLPGPMLDLAQNAGAFVR